MADQNGWKTLDSTYVYENPWIKVREDHYETPNGKKGLYGVVESDSYAMVIPKVGDSFVMVETYRYILQSRSIEFPAGGIENGESPEDAASRELLEESGLVASDLKKIGFFYSANGLTNDACHLYLAEDCLQGQSSPEDDEEGMTVKQCSHQQLADLIKSGEITDGPTISAFGLYLLNGES